MGLLQARTAEGVLLGSRIAVAHDWGTRLRGLLGRRALRPDEGLWLSPCSGIHTLGMRFSIDVLFLDAFQNVVKICHQVPPNRCRLGGSSAESVLELPAGTLSRLPVETGQQVLFRSAIREEQGGGEDG